MDGTDELTSCLWRFVRGDLSARDFEAWFYASAAVADYLGEALYQAGIETDFRTSHQVFGLRLAFARHLRSHPHGSQGACLCIRLRDFEVVDMGRFSPRTPGFEDRDHWTHEDVMGTFEELAAHGPPLWWLSAARCRACAQGWLIAQEENHHDVFCLHRLDPDEVRQVVVAGHWPPDFDRYDTLLIIASQR